MFGPSFFVLVLAPLLLIDSVYLAVSLVTWEGGDPISATSPGGQPLV